MAYSYDRMARTPPTVLIAGRLAEGDSYFKKEWPKRAKATQAAAKKYHKLMMDEGASEADRAKAASDLDQALVNEAGLLSGQAKTYETHARAFMMAWQRHRSESRREPAA